MKKLMLLVAMLAMVMMAVAPAFAQDDDDDDGGERAQEIGQESDSGDVAVAFDVASEGDYASQCATGGLQFGQTGNLENGQGVLQSDGSASDDIEAGGSTFEFAPATESECVQRVQQSSAASAAAPKAPPPPPPPPKAPPKAPPPPPKAPPPPPKAAPAPPPPPKAEAKAGAPEAKAEAPKMEMKEEKKELPKTGGSGSASLLGLGAGALLVGGGLLARRIVR